MTTTTDEGQPKESGPIAGFWRRLFALGIDSLVLVIAGLCLGYVLYDYFASLGAWGRVIGFVITVGYLGVMNSRICNGQTVGKRALGIRVVSSDGQPLSIGRSFGRAAVLCIPFSLNQAPIDIDPTNAWLLALLSVLVFGMGLSIVYLYVFNRRTRQSLHDLAVGSFVVRAPLELVIVVPAASLWRGHIAVVVVLMLLAVVAPFLLHQFVHKEPFESLIALQKALAGEPGVGQVGVVVGTHVSMGTSQEAKSRTYLDVRIRFDSKDIDREALADRLARITFGKYEEAAKKDVVAITLTYGYDIGIASSWRSQTFSHSPAEWSKRIGVRRDAAIITHPG